VATYENFESAGGGSWPGNLRADPRVTIQIGSTVASYRARPATAEETDRTMQELLSIWPAYDTYLQRSDTPPGDCVRAPTRLCPPTFGSRH
jgi:deazaflavin-dependent oxidoreductase (nitroreductase family)